MVPAPNTQATTAASGLTPQCLCSPLPPSTAGCSPSCSWPCSRAVAAHLRCCGRPQVPQRRVGQRRWCALERGPWSHEHCVAEDGPSPARHAAGAGAAAAAAGAAAATVGRTQLRRRCSRKLPKLLGLALPHPCAHACPRSGAFIDMHRGGATPPRTAWAA